LNGRQAWIAVGLQAREPGATGFSKPIPDAPAPWKQAHETVKLLPYPFISFSEMSLFNELHRKCTPPSPRLFPRAQGAPPKAPKEQTSRKFLFVGIGVQVGTPTIATIMFKPLAAHEKSAGDAPGDPAQSVLYSVHPGCDPGATGHGPHRPLSRARDGSGAASTTQAETRGGRSNSQLKQASPYSGFQKLLLARREGIVVSEMHCGKTGPPASQGDNE